MVDIQNMLPELRVIEKRHGDIVFVDNQHVQIVITGRVLLRYHEEDPLDYQYIAEYTQGRVIGHPTVDGGTSRLG